MPAAEARSAADQQVQAPASAQAGTPGRLPWPGDAQRAVITPPAGRMMPVLSPLPPRSPFQGASRGRVNVRSAPSRAAPAHHSDPAPSAGKIAGGGTRQAARDLCLPDRLA